MRQVRALHAGLALISILGLASCGDSATDDAAAAPTTTSADPTGSTATGPASSGGATADASSSGDASTSAADATGEPGTDTGTSAAPTRIFVTLVSHNEDTTMGGNPECLAFFDAIDVRYEANRAATLAIADIVVGRGAAWDFQTDVQYLAEVAARESVDDNVVRTLAELAPDHIVVDAHAHEMIGKNYADVANRVEALSGARTGVVGGFTATACNAMSPQPEWEKFWSPLSPASALGGDDFIATVLTDGASAGHVCDQGVSGVWRPTAHEAFLDDDPRAPLPNIGVGLPSTGGLEGEVAALSDLLADLHAGRLEPGRMYTSSPTIGHCDFDLADSGVTPDDIAAYIDEVDALGGDDIVWATYPAIVDIWQTQYASQPSVWTGS